MTNHRPPEDEHRGKKGKKGKKAVPGKALVSTTNGSGGKLPAPKSYNFTTNFFALTAAFDKQAALFAELYTAWRERNSPVDLRHEGKDANDVRDLWRQLYKGAEQCLADIQTLWVLDEFVEAAAKTTFPEDIHHPSQAYLVYRIGNMVAAWPDVSVSKDYAKYMAERLEAEDLNALVLESLFREIADDCKRKKPPGNGEVLSLLKPHKSRWQLRMDAIDLDKIQQRAQDTIFALDFKNNVFKEATLEYLDNHRHADLAAKMREDSELDSSDDNLWRQAQQILITNKPVTLEWDLLLKNAQRRLNHDEWEFACTNCGAGFDEERCCMVCDRWTVVSYAKWEQHIAQQQENLQQQLQQQRKLEFNLSRKQELIKELVASHDDDWMAKHIELGKLKLPSDHYIEILHCRGARWDKLPKVHDGTVAALYRFDNPMLESAITHGPLGVHYVMTCVYKIVERTKSYWEDDDGNFAGYKTCRELELKTLIPFKYEIKENDTHRETFDQSLLIDNPTLDEQAQLSELRAKLYAAYLPPPDMIAALQRVVSHRVEYGLPPSPPSVPLPLDPYDRLEAELNRCGQE